MRRTTSLPLRTLQTLQTFPTPSISNAGLPIEITKKRLGVLTDGTTTRTNENNDFLGVANCLFNKNPLPLSKNTTILGFTSEGLPFQIVAEQKSDHRAGKVSEFIESFVLPLIDVYAQKLSGSNNSEDVIKELIRNIDMLRKFQGYNHEEFELAINITYSKNNELRCAGFGIGEIGLVLRKFNGETKQLAAKREGLPLMSGYDNFHFGVDRNLESVIERCSLFDEPVDPETTILSYTNLNQDLLQTNVKFSKALDTEAVFPSFESLSGRQALKQGNSECTISAVTVPLPEQQANIQAAIYTKKRAAVTAELEKQNDDLKQAGNRVLAQIAEIKVQEAGSTPTLTRHLTGAFRALHDPSEENLKNLDGLAKKAKGKPSLLWKALGIGLMILGAGLMLVGGLAIVAGAGVSLTGILAPVGALGITAGSIMAAGGFGLFAFCGIPAVIEGRQKGLSKETTETANIIRKTYR